KAKLVGRVADGNAWIAIAVSLERLTYALASPRRATYTHTMSTAATASNTLRAGMIGMGMIFDETYRPFFEKVHADGIYDWRLGWVEVPLSAAAARTGARAEKYRQAAAGRIAVPDSFTGADAVARLLQSGVRFACVATPDDRHFEAARQVLSAGVHLLVE